MSDSPESVVREFLAASEGAAKVDLLLSFFDDDAVWVDGPRGVHHGLDALRSELEVQISMGFEVVKEDVKSLVAERGTVMLERVEHLRIGGEPFSLEVMSAFDIDAYGKITRWRDSYDLKLITDQVEAAGLRNPT